MTYFRFLRWLMFLNLFIAIIMLGITLAPFLALKPSKDPDFVSAVNACQSEYHFLASVFSQNYTDVVKAAREKESNFQKVLDVLQGTVSDRDLLGFNNFRYFKCLKILYPKILTNWHMQTVQTQTRLLLIRVYTVCHSTKYFRKQLRKSQDLGPKLIE